MTVVKTAAHPCHRDFIRESGTAIAKVKHQARSTSKPVGSQSPGYAFPTVQLR